MRQLEPVMVTTVVLTLCSTREKLFVTRLNPLILRLLYSMSYILKCFRKQPNRTARSSQSCWLLLRENASTRLLTATWRRRLSKIGKIHARMRSPRSLLNLRSRVWSGRAELSMVSSTLMKNPILFYSQQKWKEGLQRNGKNSIRLTRQIISV